MATYEYEGTFTQVDGSGNKTKLYPNVKTDTTLSVSGKAADAAAVGEAIENAISGVDAGIPIVTTAGSGSAYTATVDGVTALTVGMKITIIPHVVSTSTTPTLNINDLGAKYIRMSSSSNTGAASNGVTAAWLTASKPVTVTWDGTVWKTDIQRPAASSLDGTVAIAKGGTGASTLEGAKENLGIGTKVVAVTQSEYTALGDTVNTDGNIYAVTDGLSTPVVNGIRLGNSSTTSSMAYIYQTNDNGNIYFRYTDENDNTRYTNIRDMVTQTTDVTCSNVAITTKSGSGAYYVRYKAFAEIITGTWIKILGLMVVDWSGATASFIPYYQSDQLCFMSDVSQTVSSITVRVVYR